jgi:hypothetical protein
VAAQKCKNCPIHEATAMLERSAIAEETRSEQDSETIDADFTGTTTNLTADDISMAR